MVRPNAHVTRFGRAFTLVELIISIGILVLLLSILLPAVGAVREQGRTTLCLSNLRQLGIGFSSYSLQWKGYTMPGYADTTTVGAGGQWADAENYATMLVNLHMITAAKLAGLNVPISPSYSVLHCPSGTDDFQYNENSNSSGAISAGITRTNAFCSDPWRVQSKRTGTIVDTWYGINCTNQPAASVLTPIDRLPGQGGSYQLRTLGEIRDPTRMVLLYDGIFYDIWYDPNRINARHQNRTATNILFFDGHAATYPTASLPGGLPPYGVQLPITGVGTALFESNVLGTAHPELCWQVDQY